MVIDMSDIGIGVEGEPRPSMHEQVEEIAGRVSELPALRAAMEVIADRLAIIEDELAKPADPSELQQVLEKLVSAVSTQNEQLKKLTMLSSVPAAHAEWLGSLKGRFGGLVDKVEDPQSAVDWDWLAEHHPAPDEGDVE